MLSISHELAQRLESADAADGSECAEAQATLNPDPGAAVISVAGGYAMFLGTASPLTHALAVGMHGPITADDLDQLEHFYTSRGAQVTIDVCPHADPSLTELLAARSYKISEFTNVLVRALAAGESFGACPPPFQIRRVEPDEEAAYTDVVVRGFFGRDYVSEEERKLGNVLFHMRGAHPHFALLDGQPIAGGSVSVRCGVANCFADATLLPHRGRGAHTALIQARLAFAAEQGCDVITAGTTPGSVSQRHYERLGFQVAYTKTTMVKK
jgi:GNAT superfamily N-acetyltransferase